MKLFHFPIPRSAVALPLAALLVACDPGYSTDLLYRPTGTSPRTCAVCKPNYLYADRDVVIPQQVDINGHSYIVSSIADSAFADQPRLRSVTIPASVTVIASNAFAASQGIARYIVEPGNPYFSSDSDGCLFQDGRRILVNYPAGRTNELFDLPEGVQEVSTHAFCYSVHLRRVSLPASLKEIGQHAFYHSGVQSILVSEHNPYLIDSSGVVLSGDGKRFIQYPLGRTGDYRIPEGVERIDDRSFAHADDLGIISIPRSVEQIGPFAFYCSLVRGFDVAPGNATYSSRNGLLLSADGTRLLAVPPGRVGVLSVPEGVTDICQCAATNCLQLTEVELPTGLLRVGPGAFAYCSSLERVALPPSVRLIESGAFAGCARLDKVDVVGSNLPPTGLDNGPLEQAAVARGLTLQPCAPGYKQ